jgi:CspA family cold shock protein
MARGTVKWFSDNKGYGFISGSGDEEIFVHHASIEGEGFRTLHVGDVVEFDIKNSDRGAEATHVVKQ